MLTLTKPKVDCSPTVLTLDNGLTLIHHYIPATPVVVVDIWVQAGAIAESESGSGMAHFLEHMIFKGTDCIGPGVFDSAIESRGGITNAATSHDYAHYFIATAEQHFEETLPYLTELLLNASIPDDEFAREREVVLEEIHQAFDNPDWLAFQNLTETIYHQHPYGRPILGTKEKLYGHAPADMRRFHQQHYHPGNMTMVVVGGVPRDRVVRAATNAFRGTSGYPAPSRSRLQGPHSPCIEGIYRQALELPRLEQARLLMGWIGPGAEQLQAARGLDMLSVLLAEGRSSRLVRELREELGLVQAVSSSFSLQQESSLFTIAAWLDADQLIQVEAIIRQRMADLRSQPVTPLELARCKRLLTNDYAFSTESPSQLAGIYGYYQTIADLNEALTYPDCVNAFQPEMLQQVAQQYLDPDRYVVTTLSPA